MKVFLEGMLKLNNLGRFRNSDNCFKFFLIALKEGSLAIIHLSYLHLLSPADNYAEMVNSRIQIQ